MLAGSLSADELLRLDADTVLRRLFWEEKMRSFVPQQGDSAPRFACRCSRDRVGARPVLADIEPDTLCLDPGAIERALSYMGLTPNKPLADIHGVPMIVRVAQRAALSKARQVVVACDDARIAAAVAAFGGTAVMTRADHPTGTDRLAEARPVQHPEVVAAGSGRGHKAQAGSQGKLLLAKVKSPIGLPE